MQGLRKSIFAISKLNFMLPSITTTSNNRYFSCELRPDITMEEVKIKLGDKKIVRIDCRSPEEFNGEGHIPEFVNIDIKPFGNIFMLPEDQFEKKIGIKKPKKDDEIIIMCLLGIRARTCQLALKGYGYTNVRNYTGSFTEWRDNNETIIYPEKK